MNDFSFTLINGLTAMVAAPGSSNRMAAAQGETVQTEGIQSGNSYSVSEMGVSTAERSPYSSVQNTAVQNTAVQDTAVQDTAVVLIWLLLFLGGWLLLSHGWRQWKSVMSSSQTFHDGFPWPDRPSFGSHASRLPCATCHYFKSNRHLSCAVHPTRVLKPEAHDCPDFRPRS